MVASTLLLPNPRRAFSGAEAGEPVAQNNRYVVTQIGLGTQYRSLDVANLGIHIRVSRKAYRSDSSLKYVAPMAYGVLSRLDPLITAFC
jgi:hypothetical protein